MVDDLGVGLADAGGLEDDEIEARDLQMSIASPTAGDSARLAWRVASERM